MKLALWFILFLLFMGVDSFSQPRTIHLSWNGAVGTSTANSMSVTWADGKKNDGWVKYGLDSSALREHQSAKNQYVFELSAYVSKATLTSLRPSTRYFYRVGSDLNGWSSLYHFTTAPPAGSTSKIVVGLCSDTQNNGENLHFEITDSIVKRMSSRDYNLTLHNGDLVENGSVAKSWDALLSVMQPLNACSPLMCVVGNHDLVNDTALVAFQKPFPIYDQVMNLPGDGVNFSYNYGNVHFVAISSGCAQRAEKVNKVLFSLGSTEYQWLESDLAKARYDRHLRWIILYDHYPVYSYGVSHVDTWQSHIKPLIDRYKVDLCLAGHRHVYERHKAVRNENILSMPEAHIYNKPNGTVYITNGSCGGSPQGVGGWDLPTMAFTPREKMYTYEVMTIEGKQINYKVFDRSGKQIDYFKILK